MKTSDIKGIIPPVITPMNNDPEQTVNHQALREQVERLLAGGVHGIFPMGTNGEAYALSFQEKEEILATVIDQVKGRVPVYAGTGCITTAETIRLSKRAEELGADALSIITPSFALASQKELYDHYTAVAKAVNLPIILYNIPARTGNKLLPETVQALCRDVENIVGAKDSSGDIENLKAYIRLTRELDKEVAILAGNDGAILTCLKEGGAGGIAGRANIWPETVAKIYDCFKAGDLEGAQAAQDAIASIAVQSCSEMMPCRASMAAWTPLPRISCAIIRWSKRMEELKSLTRLSTALENRPFQSCSAIILILYFMSKPSQSRLAPCQLPRQGELFFCFRKAAAFPHTEDSFPELRIKLALRESWQNRQVLTERVNFL